MLSSFTRATSTRHLRAHALRNANCTTDVNVLCVMPFSFTAEVRIFCLWHFGASGPLAAVRTWKPAGTTVPFLPDPPVMRSVLPAAALVMSIVPPVLSHTSSSTTPPRTSTRPVLTVARSAHAPCTPVVSTVTVPPMFFESRMLQLDLVKVSWP